ncbi:hypothetical protein ACEQPO_20535 [Bacillus sp. SL00103]
MERLQLKQMLTHFFAEDIGFGDVSADGIFGEKKEQPISPQNNRVYWQVLK